MLKKTIQQHLEELPEPARTAALANIWWEDRGTLYFTAIKALQQGFNWSRSPQGYTYWFDVETDLIDRLLATNYTDDEYIEILGAIQKRL